MIQRKQTLFLLAVVIICVCSVIFNLKFSNAIYIEEGQEVPARHGVHLTVFDELRTTDGANEHIKRTQYSSVDHPKSMFLALSAAGMAFLSIFLYKNLALQLRISSLNIVLIIGLIATLFIDDQNLKNSFQNVKNHSYSWQMLLIAVLPVLNFLAVRGIKKDIELLASADRLR